MQNHYTKNINMKIAMPPAASMIIHKNSLESRGPREASCNGKRPHGTSRSLVERPEASGNVTRPRGTTRGLTERARIGFQEITRGAPL